MAIEVVSRLLCFHGGQSLLKLLMFLASFSKLVEIVSSAAQSF